MQIDADCQVQGKKSSKFSSLIKPKQGIFNHEDAFSFSHPSS